MRRTLLVAFLLLAACGDDGGGDELGDDPTTAECLDAGREVLERLEVPEGVDPSDGLDEDERAKTEAMFESAAESSGFDISDEDHPCAAATEGATQAELAEMVEGLDPEILELLGAEARQEFEVTGDSITP